MANICSMCGKGRMIGRQVTFSGKHNRRIFKPNLHAAWVLQAGQSVRKKFCTKCLRRVRAGTRAVKVGGRRVGAESFGTA